MTKNICPVCDKAGIEDYRIKHIVCPQCDTDLKSFFILNSLAMEKVPRSRKLLLANVLNVGSLFLIIFLGSYIYMGSKTHLIEKNELANLKDTLRILRDSQEKPSASLINQDKINEISIKYKVRKGDTPWKIARYFYNDGAKYDRILEVNKLQTPIVLTVGQVLTINLNQE